MIKMIRNYKGRNFLLLCLLWLGCKTQAPLQNYGLKPLPALFAHNLDSANSAQIKWRDFFSDKNLISLIDTALFNNQDVLITLQEIEIARSNVSFRNGLLFPKVSGGGALSIEKVGRFTSQGAGDASAEITPGNLVPELLPNFFFGIQTSWEVDVWGKLRNAKKAAFAKYLSSIEGKNFVVTNLVSEVANIYFELIALDNQLEIIRETIKLQNNALDIVKIQKEASKASELAVKQFEAQVFNSQSMEFEIAQKITESENKINFLLGRFPQSVIRDKSSLSSVLPNQIKEGIPSQLLINRTDIKQAELELLAAKCDVQAARAEFYPSFDITGLLGLQAFKSAYLFTLPQSLAYSLFGDLAAPLINRSAIKAEFNKAKAYQIEAMAEYQKAILNGFFEVSNELSNINNLEKVYLLKSKQVDALTKSIEVSDDLFKSGRADYLEVLMAQRDALEAKLDLVETKKRQLNAITNVYKALGGGWR